MYARLGKQVLPTMSSTEIEAIHRYVLRIACDTWSIERCTSYDCVPPVTLIFH